MNRVSEAFNATWNVAFPFVTLLKTDSVNISCLFWGQLEKPLHFKKERGGGGGVVEGRYILLAIPWSFPAPCNLHPPTFDSAVFGSEIWRTRWNRLLRLIWHFFFSRSLKKDPPQTSESPLTNWYIYTIYFISAVQSVKSHEHAFISLLILKSSDKISSVWAGVLVTLKH